jgi:hypothetical protein
MPARKQTSYTINDHKKAFELFYQLGSMNAVSRDLGIDNHTIRRWADGDGGCSCPWHNWDALVREKDEIINARIGLLENDQYDPVAHEQAILNYDPHKGTEISEERLLQIRRATKVMVRSDAERLTQLEYLWSKVFYHATGIVTDHTIFMDEQSGNMMEDALREEYFKRGMDPKNLEGCIKCLNDLMEQIDEVRRSLGLKKGGLGGGQASATPEKVDADKVNKELTLDELREFRKLLASEEPAKVKLMLEALKADDNVNDTLAHTRLPQPSNVIEAGR